MSGALAAGARVRNWYFGPAALRFDDNQLAVAESRGGNSITRHDSMSVLRMVTDATGILIDGLASQAAASNQECLGVYCNGAWLTSVSFATQNTVLTKAVALPVGAGKIVEIWEGAQLDVSGGLDGSDVRGAYAYAVRGLTGFAPAATPPRKIVVYGDSIACGYYATIPVRDGWFPQARLAYQLAGGRMALEAWGGRSIGREPDVDAEAARLVAHVAGSATRIILITIGTNDFGLGTARATFRSRAGQLLDGIRSRDAGAAVYWVLPLLRTDAATPNSAGAVLADYAADIATVQSTRTWLTIVDPSAWLLVGDLVGDGVHPGDTGHAKVLAQLRLLLGF